jgi:gluconokinase
MAAMRHSAAEESETAGPPAVLVVMGVSGSGKSTVARLLAERLGWDLQEGDDLHPPANVAKMSAGIPLTDDDRWPWLRLVAQWIDAHRSDGTHGVITCSALKRSYRDRLARPDVEFVHLTVDPDVVANRMEHRAGHFMPASLLDSQLATLEPLQPDERGIVVSAAGAPEAEVDSIIARLGLR